MAETVVTSEIAGVVFQIEVEVGETVGEDHPLLIIESMKMHIPVEAPCAGAVTEILVAAGDVVGEGQPVAKIG